MFFVTLDMNAILSVNKTITIAPIRAILALDVISSKINKIFKKYSFLYENILKYIKIHNNIEKTKNKM